MPADFVFTDEHDELRKTVRAFLAGVMSSEGRLLPE